MSHTITCSECGSKVIQQLVDRGNGPESKLACDCYVFDRTEGIYVPFESDIPDRWYDSEE